MIHTKICKKHSLRIMRDCFKNGIIYISTRNYKFFQHVQWYNKDLRRISISTFKAGFGT